MESHSGCRGPTQPTLMTVTELTEYMVRLAMRMHRVRQTLGSSNSTLVDTPPVKPVINASAIALVRWESKRLNIRLAHYRQSVEWNIHPAEKATPLDCDSSRPVLNTDYRPNPAKRGELGEVTARCEFSGFRRGTSAESCRNSTR